MKGRLRELVQGASPEELEGCLQAMSRKERMLSDGRGMDLSDPEDRVAAIEFTKLVSLIGDLYPGALDDPPIFERIGAIWEVRADRALAAGGGFHFSSAFTFREAGRIKVDFMAAGSRSRLTWKSTRVPAAVRAILVTITDGEVEGLVDIGLLSGGIWQYPACPPPSDLELWSTERG